jgi:hypothetical protein
MRTGPFTLRLDENNLTDLYLVRPDGDELLIAGMVVDDKEYGNAVVEVINAAIGWADARYRQIEAEQEKAMICSHCADKDHDKCKGCTCQHRPLTLILKPEGIDSGEAVGDIGGQ